MVFLPVWKTIPIKSALKVATYNVSTHDIMTLFLLIIPVASCLKCLILITDILIISSCWLQGKWTIGRILQIKKKLLVPCYPKSDTNPYTLGNPRKTHTDWLPISITTQESIFLLEDAKQHTKMSIWIHSEKPSNYRDNRPNILKIGTNLATIAKISIISLKIGWHLATIGRISLMYLKIGRNKVVTSTLGISNNCESI